MKRRLFYLSGSTLPSRRASAVQVMKMCRAFAVAGGCDVTLFAKGVQGPAEELCRYYGVEPVFATRLARVLPVPFLGGVLRVCTTLQSIRRMPAPDILYGRDMWSMACLAGCEIPMVFELHEMPGRALANFALRRILAARNFTGLVVISHALKADVLARYPQVPEARIHVAPDGADIEENIVPASLEKPPGGLAIGYAGSLYEGKGIRRIIELARLKPTDRFYIFGGSPCEVKEKRKSGASANIVFYGHVPHGQLGGYLAACDILLAPFQERIRIDTGRDIARWTSPLKIFEYMAAGRPMICSNLPVIREVLADGENALLVPPGDTESWAAAIERLRGDIHLREKLAGRARRDLEQRFSWPVRAAGIIMWIKNWIS